MLRNFKFIFIFILFFANCSKNKEDNSVKLNISQNKGLLLGCTSKIIQLENSSDSKLKDIRESRVDLNNNRVFILSDFNIYIFNSNGEFLTKLKKGRGPEEISMILSFTLDKQRKLIYAIDLGNRICIFDYEGSMIRTHKILNFYGMAIEILNDNNILLLNNTPSKTNPFLIAKYNLEKETITQELISSEHSNYPLLSYSMPCNFTPSGNNLFFAYSSIFGLYKYEKDTFKRIITYDLEEMQVPQKFSNKFNKGRRMGVFRDEAKRHGYVPYLKSSFFFKKHNLVIIDDEDLSCFAISDNLKKVYHKKSISKYFDLPDVKSLKVPIEIGNDYIIFYCQPLDFFNTSELNQRKHIKIGENTIDLNYDSNPFLIMVN